MKMRANRPGFGPAKRDLMSGQSQAAGGSKAKLLLSLHFFTYSATSFTFFMLEI